MKPNLTASPWCPDEPNKFVLLTQINAPFTSPFVVNKPEDAHKLAAAWNAYEDQRTLPMDKLREACSHMLQNSDLKPHTVAGRRMIHAFWAGVIHLQQALGFTPSAHVTVCLMAGRHEELISKSKD